MEKEQLELLLGEMTLADKIGFPQALQKTAGSILGSSGAEEVKEIIDTYAEHNRLGIPLIVMADIIHGYKTFFSIPLAMGASWNLELTEKDITYIGPENRSVIEAGAKMTAEVNLRPSYSNLLVIQGPNQ